MQHEMCHRCQRVLKLVLFLLPIVTLLRVGNADLLCPDLHRGLVWVEPSPPLLLVSPQVNRRGLRTIIS
jgi:hypothetical protein